LLFIFYILDTILSWSEESADHPSRKLAKELYTALKKEQLKQSIILKTIQYLEKPTLHISGAYNFWLLPIIFLVLIFTAQVQSNIPYREISMIVLAIYSFIITPVIHFKKEVVTRLLDLIFLYFFSFFIVGMIARMFIEEYPIYIDTIYKAWFMASIAGFLDNVPAAIIIFNPEFLSRSLLDESNFFIELIHSEKKFKNITALLLGISIMGGLTYIGNYINIFIKHEAEKSGIKMPNFFTYLLYSIPVTAILSTVVLLYLMKLE